MTVYPLSVAIAGLQVAEPGLLETSRKPDALPRVVKNELSADALKLLDEKLEP